MSDISHSVMKQPTEVTNLWYERGILTSPKTLGCGLRRNDGLKQ